MSDLSDYKRMVADPRERSLKEQRDRAEAERDQAIRERDEALKQVQFLLNDGTGDHVEVERDELCEQVLGRRAA